jgi:ribosome-binding protein aMBF1 (putative translation factor)
MKTKNHSLKMPTKKTDLKWYTVDEVFGKYAKNKAFQMGYRKEALRIKLATQIKEARLAKKLTQDAVAQKAKMPQSVIARLESGEHGISLDTLNKVAIALGKHVELV